VEHPVPGATFQGAPLVELSDRNLEYLLQELVQGIHRQERRQQRMIAATVTEMIARRSTGINLIFWILS
jgi:hypothetical protein